MALGVLVLCWHCPTLADTDIKKRHRLVFKMLTTSREDRSTNRTNTYRHKLDSNIVQHVNRDILNRTSTMDLLRGSSEETPLISGDKNKMTLTMLGKFKKTWCKTEPFMQLIKERGCLSRKILNRFCYGQCNSFYIPRTIRKRTKNKVFKSCGFCKPKKTHTILVTLKCPGSKKGYKHKKIKQVKQCRCMER